MLLVRFLPAHGTVYICIKLYLTFAMVCAYRAKLNGTMWVISALFLSVQNRLFCFEGFFGSKKFLVMTNMMIRVCVSVCVCNNIIYNIYVPITYRITGNVYICIEIILSIQMQLISCFS